MHPSVDTLFSSKKIVPPLDGRVPRLGFESGYRAVSIGELSRLIRAVVLGALVLEKFTHELIKADHMKTVD